MKPQNMNTQKMRSFGLLESLHDTAKSQLKNMPTVQQAVSCPTGAKSTDWITVHIIDFLNQLREIVSASSNICTHDTCPVMNAGSRYQYLWADEEIVQPINCSAPVYAEFLFNWTESKLNGWSDEELSIYFKETARTIFKRLFRIYAHMYYSHFKSMESRGQHVLLNRSFRHFIVFAKKHDLITSVDMKPLEVLIQKMELGKTKRDSKANLRLSRFDMNLPLSLPSPIAEVHDISFEDIIPLPNALSTLAAHAASFKPSVVILGVSNDMESLLAALESCGYLVNRIWDGHSSFEDCIQQTCPDLVIINGIILGKHHDTSILEVVEYCLKSNISFGMTPVSIPLGRRRDVMELLQKYKNTGPCSFTFHPLRFHSSLMNAKYLLEDLSLGKQLGINIQMRISDDEYSKQAVWLSTNDALDIFSWLLGSQDVKITQLKSSMLSDVNIGDIDNIVTLSTTMETENQIVGNIGVTFFAESKRPYSFNIDVIFEHGSVSITETAVTIFEHSKLIGTRETSACGDLYEESMKELLKQLKVHLIAEKQPELVSKADDIEKLEEVYTILPTVQDGFKSRRITDAIYRQTLMREQAVNNVRDILKLSPSRIRSMNESTKIHTGDSRKSAAKQHDDEIPDYYTLLPSPISKSERE